MFSIMFPRQRMTNNEVPGRQSWPRLLGDWVRWASGARKRCGGSIDVTNNGIGPFTDLCVWKVTGRDLSPTGFHLVLLSSCPLYPSTHTAKLSCFPLTSFNRPTPKLAPTFNSSSVPTASARVFRIVPANLVAVALIPRVTPTKAVVENKRR
jgi:hypothetical protein